MMMMMMMIIIIIIVIIMIIPEYWPVTTTAIILSKYENDYKCKRNHFKARVTKRNLAQLYITTVR